MFALLLGLVLTTLPGTGQDLTGYYQLDLPMGALGLEVTRNGEEYGAIFHREGAPPAHAQRVAVKENVIEVVLLAHGTELSFRMEVTGDRVAGRYTAGGSDETEFTGRKLERRPTAGG